MVSEPPINNTARGFYWYSNGSMDLQREYNPNMDVSEGACLANYAYPTNQQTERYNETNL